MEKLITNHLITIMAGLILVYYAKYRAEVDDKLLYNKYWSYITPRLFSLRLFERTVISRR
jgi:hypothetical protein